MEHENNAVLRSATLTAENLIEYLDILETVAENILDSTITIKTMLGEYENAEIKN